MRNKIITFVAAIALSFGVCNTANAQWGWGGWYGGYGYGGYGYGAALGAGLAISALAGAAIAASASPYYNPYYGPYYGDYYAPTPRVYQRKQIIIRNSPGARVIEQDNFDW